MNEHMQHGFTRSYVTHSVHKRMSSKVKMK
uniref:Uncharacterized protein n=1 Tax=Rhizophora mucronata TaxID=61149 RepID=A0A2P2PDN7_RHIMU